ncbi:hypothetical protein LCGC14_1210380 [marine sediment metagenome]|uniref:Uncharacterized protein n=1 Tax=marine sediment metagenome TaxID=412755 RepID=A0A0F9M1M2_9ZZZZ
MADSAWSIRFFQGNNYKDDGTIDIVSNFKRGKSRQLDTIITYNGMYGIDNYLIWNIHKNLPTYDFSTVVLNLNLHLYKTPKIVYFQDFYRVQDIRYNPSKSQYTLYAITESSVKLHSKLTKFGVKSLSYKKNRKASDIIREVIEGNDIFFVTYHEDEEGTKDMIDYEYRYFAIDIEWTVLDFIQYICNDNMYEWCLDKTVDEDNVPTEILHFGHEIKAWDYRNATKKYEIEKDNISHSINAMKITTDGSPMEPLAHWEETLRCVWSKHAAGKGGGISKGCFIPIGGGHFDKFIYLRTLEGGIEKDIGYSMLTKKKKRFPSIGIGNILKDEGDYQFIDEISIQKNPPTYSIREPHNILINRGEDILVQHQLEKITRSTPYLDHNAGMLYPSPKLDNPPPNSLIFNIDGKRESAVLGPYVYGDGRIDRDEDGKPTGDMKLIIPFKENKGDLRLQLPNGWCLYIKEDGETFIQKEGADPTTVPTLANSQIYLGANGSIKFNGGGHFISHDTHKHGYQHTHQTGNMGIPIPPQSHIGPGIETDATTDNSTKTEVE